MKQKLQDLLLFLRSDRRAIAIIVVGLFGVGYLFFAPSSATKKRGQDDVAQNIVTPQGQTSFGQEGYEDLVKALSGQIGQIEQQNAQNSAEIKSIKTSMDENTERTAEIFKKIIERITESESAQNQIARTNVSPTDINDVGIAGAGAEAGGDTLEHFGMEQQVQAPPPPPPARKYAFVGAGDSVRLKLLSGVNAPVDGSPYPVVFKLASDIYGPDGSALALGEARIIAAAQGSLTDSRALFRLTSLNLRLPDGRRKVIDIDGWVVGEDGIRGMSGVLLDPIGKAIGAAAFTGALDGLGRGFSASQQRTLQDFQTGDTSQIVDGDVGKYAAGIGISSAAREWSGIVRERVSQLIPQVQVLSGREATAVFSKSFAVPDLMEALAEDDSSMEAMN